MSRLDTAIDVIVFFVCDTGERYLSKVHNIEWLRINQMLDTEVKTLRDISELKKSNGNEDIVYVTSDALVKDALELITKKGYSNIPVMLNRKAIGCVRENKLMARLLNNKELLEASVKEVMTDCVPVLDAKTELSKVKEVMKENTAVLVSDFGRITDIITRYDLINFYNKN